MKKSILIISSEFPPGPGGIGQHAYLLAKSLHNSGFILNVFSTADYVSNLEILNFDRNQKFNILRFKRYTFFFTYIARVLSILYGIKKYNVTTVFLTGKFSLWQSSLISLFYPRVNTIAILHGSEVNLNNFILRIITHFSIYKVDNIIAVSNFTKSLLPSWILEKHPSIAVIPNGIEFNDLLISDFESILLKGFPRLLTIGHTSPRKGQHRVIKALPSLIKKWPDIHYHIVGRSDNQKSLLLLAKQLNVVEHITFHGRISDHKYLGNYYFSSDVFMLLSENQPNGDVEGFGIVALEANFYGLPVVGAKFCGVEEAVLHKQTGYLVDGNNFDEIADAVEFCISNKLLLNESMKNWINQYQWSNLISKFSILIR